MINVTPAMLLPGAMDPTLVSERAARFDGFITFERASRDEKIVGWVGGDTARIASRNWFEFQRLIVSGSVPWGVVVVAVDDEIGQTTVRMLDWHAAAMTES